MLFYTGRTRKAGNILSVQDQRTAVNLEQLHCLKALATRTAEALDRLRLWEVGRVLNDGWQLKRQLAEGISSPEIEEMYDLALERGRFRRQDLRRRRRRIPAALLRSGASQGGAQGHGGLPGTAHCARSGRQQDHLSESRRISHGECLSGYTRNRRNAAMPTPVLTATELVTGERMTVEEFLRCLGGTPGAEERRTH